MKTTLAKIISALTLNRVRFIYDGEGNVSSLRWVWTPWTYRFAHGGWIRTSAGWLWRFRNGAHYRFDKADLGTTEQKVG